MAATTVPETDLTISRLSLGTMTFGGQVDEHEAARVLDIALDGGVTFIDTANGYARGRSEELLGQLLKGRRDEVVLASKVGSPSADVQGPPLHPDEMRRHLEASLRRLQTDYLDVYYLHRPDRSTPLEDSLAALDEFVRQGLVRHPAASNYAAWHFAHMRGLAQQHGWTPVRISQPMYNLLARRIEDEYLEATACLGIANVVYNPLAAGLLTGKHRGVTKPAEGTRFALRGYRSLYQSRYWNDQQFAGVEALAGVAEEAGISLIELAFRWLLSQPAAASILVGVSSAAQLEHNLHVCASGPLPDDVLEACDEVRSIVHGTAPSYVK